MTRASSVYSLLETVREMSSISKVPTMANMTGSLSYTQSESRTGHECVHDGLVQLVLEACAQPPRTRSQDAQKWYKRRIGNLWTRATHRRATAHRVRFKVLIHVLGTDWSSRRDDQQPHA